MIRVSFDDGWQARPKVNPFAELGGAATAWEQVRLPHDAMIGQRRAAPQGEVTMAAGAGAYFPGGVFEYRKVFVPDEEWRGKRILIEFEGVYRDAVVFINGDYAGQRPYGYAHFRIDADRFLRFGRDNTIRVEARAHQDSRWYTGAGIYRPTWLLVGDLVRIAPDGLRATVPDLDADRAVVEVTARVENDSVQMRTLRALIRVLDPEGAVAATDTALVTVLPGEVATVRRRLYLAGPRLWDPADPALHTCVVELVETGELVDAETITFGIRRLQLDPVHGLRVNGRTVKLRGACVHHDSGVLGAATFARAEERRVRLLREAGFNAIRMSHHPMSRAMLAACDRLGVLVVDEAFDVWTSAKSDFDYSLSFPEWWERDIEAMVVKDVNHPSVVMYSIGNEIPEAGSAAGAARGRRLAEKVRSLDPTRYVTNGVNGMLTVLADLAAGRAGGDGGGQGINAAMTDMAATMDYVSSSDLVTERTDESFGVLDVAGMNYSQGRYTLDKDLFPTRIIVGTETFPTRIDGNWRLVLDNGHVLGDFTWTGWDYLGEVGIGRPQYLDTDDSRPVHTAAFPHLLAGCGDLDITGYRRPASYYREIVFGLRTEPYLAVRRPEHHGRVFAGSPWAWSDCIAGWTWPGFEDAPVTVEVYSDADEVELLVNGDSLGRAAAGEAHRFRALFETVYRPGELVAVAYRDGRETGRTRLRTAGAPVRLDATADRPVITAAAGDLAFVSLTLRDADGTCHPMADRSVRIEVSGDGVLQGLGSAEPATTEGFAGPEHRTYEGRALAVVRPTGAGKIRLAATAAGCEPVEVTVTVEAAGA